MSWLVRLMAGVRGESMYVNPPWPFPVAGEMIHHGDNDYRVTRVTITNAEEDGFDVTVRLAPVPQIDRELMGIEYRPFVDPHR
jgi:hypothetical protein